MSKQHKLKTSKRLSGEVDLLLDSGFHPDAIKRYLKLHYGIDVNMADIYRYKRDYCSSRQYRNVHFYENFKILADYQYYSGVFCNRNVLEMTENVHEIGGMCE